MSKKRIRYIVLFLFFLVELIAGSKKVYSVDEFPSGDINGDITGNSYLIGLNDLYTNNHLYCVAKGRNLGMDKDEYIVDARFRINAGDNKFRGIWFDTSYGTINMKRSDLYDINTRRMVSALYNLQYKLCNNNYIEGYNYAQGPRQYSIWNYWNDFCGKVDADIYNRYISLTKLMSKYDTNYNNNQLNNGFEKEAQIYANVLEKNPKSVKADINVLETKNSTIKFKYTGIITGIYDSYGNRIQVRESGNIVNLENWDVGYNTEKVINVGDNKVVKIQVASTDTDLIVYHLKNKNVYFNSYNESKMGQDLIACYYTKSPDITKTISFDGSTPGGGNQQTEIITTTKYNISLQKKDSVSNIGIKGVNIKLTTMLDGNYTVIEKETDSNGIVEFLNDDGLYPGTYDVWEKNPNVGYVNEELKVGQINVDNTCYWTYFAGNAYGVSVENVNNISRFIIINEKKTATITLTKIDAGTGKVIPRNLL